VVVAVTLACAFGLQQLQVQPYPGTVGAPVVVTARRGDGAPLQEAVHVELPGGGVVACGVTGADGALTFTPDRAGHHVFVARVDGVRTLAPLAVVPARTRWPLALAAVPLGLAFVWWNLSRARGRRDP
jgi:hypothetical protein